MASARVDNDRVTSSKVDNQALADAGTEDRDLDLVRCWKIVRISLAEAQGAWRTSAHRSLDVRYRAGSTLADDGI